VDHPIAHLSPDRSGRVRSGKNNAPRASPRNGQMMTNRRMSIPFLTIPPQPCSTSLDGFSSRPLCSARCHAVPTQRYIGTPESGPLRVTNPLETQPPLHPVPFDVREVLTVPTRCALVGAALGIGRRPHRCDGRALTGFGFT
jgi:hypothetical protein